MSIEFRCTQCGKLLRTPDETGGQQAKCPACGTVVTVPMPATLVKGSEFGAPDARGAAPGYETVNPYQTPVDAAAGGGQYGPSAAPVVGVRPTKIRFGDVFGQAWTIFAEQWAMAIGVVLLWLVIFLCIVGAAVGGVFLIGAVTQEAMVVIPIAVLAVCAGAIALVWLGVGVQLFFIKMARGLEVDIGDLFAGGPYLLRNLGGSALYGLAVFVITSVLILPCVVLCLAIDMDLVPFGLVLGGLLSVAPVAIFGLTFYQFSYLIIDRNMGIMESFSVSQRVTSGNRLMMFAIILVMAVAGSAINKVTCSLGTFVVTPFTLLLYAVMYVQMIGHPTAARRAEPAAPVGATDAGDSPF